MLEDVGDQQVLPQFLAIQQHTLALKAREWRCRPDHYRTERYYVSGEKPSQHRSMCAPVLLIKELLLLLNICYHERRDMRRWHKPRRQSVHTKAPPSVCQGALLSLCSIRRAGYCASWPADASTGEAGAACAGTFEPPALRVRTQALAALRPMPVACIILVTVRAPAAHASVASCS